MLALRTFALLALCSLARAQGPLLPSYERPGSLLLFSEYDDRPGNSTLLTVTNTDTASDANPVIVTFRYISEGTCLEFNRNELLTPGDTLTVLTNQHAPLMNRGYVFVTAASNDGQQPIVHNHLIGSAMQISSLSSYDYSYDAISYQGMGTPGSLTDLDNDGIRDLDGSEYAGSPARVNFPRFIGTSFLRSADLILINLSGGREFDTILNFLAWNDNEEVFSAQYLFNCWERVPLTSISSLFRNDFLQATGHDPFEIVGATYAESGWFQIEGSVAFSSQTTIQDPAFHAMLVETARRLVFSGGFSFWPIFLSFSFVRSDTASLPFYEGVQFNGDLLPTGVFGDVPPIGLGG